MAELPPFVMEQHSDDGGITWSHENWKPLLNVTGNHLYRVVFQRQGSSYNRMYRLRYSDNSSFTLVSAHMTATFEP
jgi:hypothetical protein